jgi:hypothetical protein
MEKGRERRVAGAMVMGREDERQAATDRRMSNEIMVIVGMNEIEIRRMETQITK